MNLRYKYGFAQDWNQWPECVQSIKELPGNHDCLCFYREKNSHKGISKFQNTRKLIAKQVNSDFLEEISALTALNYLNLEVVTSRNLKPLLNLKKLKTLKIYGVRKADDFSPLVEIPSLENLFIETAKHLHTLDVFSNAHHIKALGIEGGMYAKQKIKSLKPQAGLKALEVLFMSSVQLEDKCLTPLAAIARLKAQNKFTCPCKRASNIQNQIENGVG